MKSESRTKLTAQHWPKGTQSSRAAVLILSAVGVLALGILLLAGCEIESGYLDSIEKQIEEDLIGPEGRIKPTVEITSTSSMYAQLPIPITITFSTPVTGFTESDIQLTNAAIADTDGFSTLDNTVFDVNLSNPTADPVVITILVPADVASNSYDTGNSTASLEVTYDTSILSAAISSSETSPTNLDPIPVTVEFSLQVVSFGLSDIACTNCTATNLVTSGNPVFTLDLVPSGDGSVQIVIPDDTVESAVNGKLNVEASFSIIYDGTRPDPPDVSGTTPTVDLTPTWSWNQDTSGGNNSGYFRYRIIGNNWSTATTSTLYTAPTQPDNAEITLTFEVQERSPAGVWSGSGTYTTIVDNLGPTAPNVGTTGTTSSPTEDATPTWYWTSGGSADSAGVYRSRLDNAAFPSSGDTSTRNWTADTLDEGNHTLYVWEKDTMGNWSPTPGSHPIEVDFLPDGDLIIRDPDNGNSSSLAKDWSVNLDSSGVTNATQMRFRNPEDSFGSFITKSNSYSWTLSPGDGTRTVYAEYRDSQGNVHSTSNSISCIPSWDNVGSWEINSWPKNNSAINGGSPYYLSSILGSGNGFVFGYSTFETFFRQYAAKVVVNSRTADVINVKIVGYTYYSGSNTWSVTYSSSSVSWDCNPKIYINLKTGETSTSEQTGSDISIYYHPLNKTEEITSLRGTALDRWNPSQ